MSFYDVVTVQDQGTPPPLPEGDSDGEYVPADADACAPPMPLDVPPLPLLQRPDALTASGVDDLCKNTIGAATRSQAAADGLHPEAPQPTGPKHKARRGDHAVRKRHKKGPCKNSTLVARNLEEDEVSSIEALGTL